MRSDQRPQREAYAATPGPRWPLEISPDPRPDHHATLSVGGAHEDVDVRTDVLGVRCTTRTVLDDGSLPIHRIHGVSVSVASRST